MCRGQCMTECIKKSQIADKSSDIYFADFTKRLFLHIVITLTRDKWTIWTGKSCLKLPLREAFQFDLRSDA